MTGRDAIGFHIVTGFLGAGKTTLINRLLRAPELADALVIVNEWGEIGLDHLLYETLTGDAILINSGCVCCALRGDLVETLRDVMARRDSGALPAFCRIVLETTGLAEPAPILHALVVDPELSSRLALAGVTTLVDGVNGLATLRSRPESARQIAVADRLVVAKSDLLPQIERATRLAELDAALRDLNRSAPIVDGAAAEFGPAEFLAEASSSPARSAGEGDHAIGRRRRPSFDGLWRGGGGKRSLHGIQSFAFRSAEPVDPRAFAQFLSLVGLMLGPRLLRLKGLFALADRPETPILVDGVQHVFHAPRALPGWPDADRSTRVVIIVEDAAARDVDNLWAALTRAPRIDAPDLAALTDNPLAPRAGGLLG
ncbi:MAG TPA: GTP-binding protein [Roseiarcus sp.]|nr:GTP-binding protein [Roseiarcus sp.]